MTVNVQENSLQTAQPVQQEKNGSKEYNFQLIRQQMEKERAEKEEIRRQAEKDRHELEELKKKLSSNDHGDEEEDDAEPYVDKRKLAKQLNRFGENTEQKIKQSMQSVHQSVKDEIRQEMWIENNPDFFEVLQHADKLAQRSPRLAEAILKMPDNFDRQKLVYQNIKEFGLDRPEPKTQTMQEKIDSNRKPMFYQPTSVPNAPNEYRGDFSKNGQKDAYDKMMALKSRMGGR